MKKAKSILTILLILAACTSEEPGNIFQSASDNINAIATEQSLRSVDEAVEIAQKALFLLSDIQSPNARSNSYRHVDTKQEAYTIVSNAKSRSASPDTLMYVVNYTDDMGFAIVSAPRNAIEILAVTVNGNYDPSVRDTNPGFNFFMDVATSYLEEAMSQSITTDGTSITLPQKPLDPIPCPEYKEVRDTTWFVNVANRVLVAWGQNYPEGLECPNTFAGCSNTAAAMMMTHFKYPDQLTLTYKSNNPKITLDWNALCKHKPYSGTEAVFQFCNCSNETHNALSYLCRELGHRAHSIYGKKGTSTYILDMQHALTTLGLNAEHKRFDTRSMAYDLQKANSVLLVRGTDANTGTIGHMWVCDAAKAYNVKIDTYECKDPRRADSLKKWDYIGTRTECLTYNFFNWGWNGKCNGFFYEGVFSVSPSSGENYNFNGDIQYLKVTK